MTQASLPEETFESTVSASTIKSQTTSLSTAELAMESPPRAMPELVRRGSLLTSTTTPLQSTATQKHANPSELEPNQQQDNSPSNILLAKLVATLSREKLTTVSQYAIIITMVCNVILFLYKLVHGAMWLHEKSLKKPESNAQQNSPADVALVRRPAASEGQSTEDGLISATADLKSAAADLKLVAAGLRSASEASQDNQGNSVTSGQVATGRPS
ncbi:hypothetical protein GLAREA_07256 [Glarea lozoyensis ATCC 20868]|uniref:Uncharacterized protein n=1 Tax=Glarea lozoyensis (strain ATCC 20868 / MF5171) TaxID=1116229 RepID=S3E7D9_GLAL2|nr:uncharacterized protein GLAREA_07256 [Glarea lozoyensis ATCC 20868]EPE34243.1 hypothetical protein GLAREA_07256 [Glarea lozoyensis ATCC 20868]